MNRIENDDAKQPLGIRSGSRFTLIELLACQPKLPDQAGTGRRRRRSRFTLIELLVCVAIIGMLAALLMPALSRVRYKAKLIDCMNSLKQVGLSVMMYAGENDDRYPHRTVFDCGQWATAASVRCHKGGDRDLWVSMDLDTLHCPFVRPVPVDASGPEVIGSYSFYFGMRFYTSEMVAGNDSMLRVGRPLINKYGEEFDILACDVEMDLIGKMRSSHPDSASILGPADGGSNPLRNNVWYASSDGFRGDVDLNYCREDLSVFLVRGIGLGDSKLGRLPFKTSNAGKPLYHATRSSAYFSLVPTVDYTD